MFVVPTPIGDDSWRTRRTSHRQPIGQISTVLGWGRTGGSGYLALDILEFLFQPRVLAGQSFTVEVSPDQVVVS